MPQLSAFADEVTSVFTDQVKFLTDQNVPAIEPRFIDNKNIMDLTPDELKQAKTIINDHGLKVSAIGSPIGKVRLDLPFQPHLDKFKHAVDLALHFQTTFIRMFSYYPPEGKNIADYKNAVIDRMHAKLEIIKDLDIILVHENEAKIYGQTAQQCLDILQAVNSPQLRQVYDPANFVFSDQNTKNIENSWPLLKPYVAHIHIKDWKTNQPTGSLPGHGHAQIPQLLQQLAQMDYQGYLTMEPHLQQGGQFGGSTGPHLFAQALTEIRKLAEQNDLNLQ